jgi:hypothetical protein
MGCIPLLLSKNQGSDMTYGGDYQRLWEDFPDEKMRGVKDPFDPWFARWKIVGEISLPLRFRQTGSEMRRAFLLMKNRGGGTKIDIDERLDALKEGRGDEGNTTEEEAEEKESQEEKDRHRRLERIRKRKEKIREESQ